MSTGEAEKVTLPERIGPFRVLRFIGRGGMGIVYEAERVSDGQRVAVKTVAVNSAGLLGAIRVEVAALKGINHPGVIRILEDGLAEGARVTHADALAVQLRGELAQVANGACTTFVVSARGTANRETLIGQTSDTPAELMEFAYVLHLEPSYAQAHPAEDFAETFAVWLRPRSPWRAAYDRFAA